MKGRLARSSLFLVIVISSARMLAQQLDETLPGFKPNNTLESHGIDNINLFSGDPGVVVPLGPEYPLGPGNSWQLKAYYSSKLWFFDVSDCETDNPPVLGVRHAYVRGYPTLGAGWTLTPGYINTESYVSPDGGRHQFQGGQTIDGTHLRVTAYPSYYKVEFPDGTVQTFAHQSRQPQPVSGTDYDFIDSGYGLSSITDSFGNTLLTVDYVSNLPDNDSWKIKDVILNPGSQQRQINFTWSPKGVGVTWDTVDKIDFPTAGGTLTVAFTYITPVSPNPVVNRNAFDNSVITSGCRTGGISNVPLLSTLTLESGSTSLGAFSFTYQLSTPGTSTPLDGVLQHMTLPTGGTIDYTYARTATSQVFTVGSPDPETGVAATNVTPTAPCHINNQTKGSAQLYIDSSAAVVTRVERDPVNGASTTNYSRVQVIPYDGVNPDDCGVTRVVVVTRPSGNGTGTLATRYLFHADVIGAQGGGLELERRIYQDSNAAGTPVRTIVNCHEADVTSSTCGFRTSAGLVQDYGFSPGTTNPRQQSTRTWYGVNDNGGGSCAGNTTPCTASVNSAYNATAGKYATATVTSTLTPMPGWQSRATTTAWNPLVDSTHWLLNLYDSKSITDGGTSLPSPSSMSTSYTFDRSLKPGFLLQAVTTDSTYGTLTRTFISDAFGNPTTASASGSGTGLASTTFTNTRAFQSGLMTSDQRSGISWKSFDVSRDTNSGLITTSRDPNSTLATSYTYDVLGRLKTVTPPGGELATTISYDSTTQTTVSRGSGSSGTWQRYIYDGLGRLSRSIRQMPSNYAFRTHTYDAAGHASFVSEWGSCTSTSGDCLAGSPGGTTSSNFDPFGRAQTITKADNTTVTIDRTDGSILFSDSFEAVTVTVSGASSVTKTRKDPLGRLIKVTEPVVGVADDTFYAYNALDKLACVKQGGTSDMTNCTSNPNGQYRAFAYYTFGFLRSGTTPERGTVNYSSYDALGDVLTKAEPPVGNPTTYTSVYDAAGRLTSLSTNEGGSRQYLSSTYDQNQSSSNYSFGRLSTRTATNYAVTPTVTVTDTFTYGNSAGRLSAETTTVTSGVLGATTQNWFYNSLGLPAHHYHGRPSGVASFVVSMAYSYGLPVTEYVNGVPMVKSLGYQPAGGLAAYTTGIGIGLDVTTAISPDTSLIRRPRQISTTGASPNFDTGVYSYDGVGNITAIGSDTFAYDARSRLSSAAYSGQGSQAYVYDRYGNMTSKAGVSLPVSATTNHLTNATYDPRGNLTTYGSEAYTYDGLDRMTQYQNGAVTYKYLYDGASERGVKIPPSPGDWAYTFRDESSRVSTEYSGANQSRDNVFVGNLLVASYANAAVAGNGSVWTFYSSDHLGTPRLITDVSGAMVETRKYWPYGDDTGSATSQRLRFATMERDTEGSRYYDHARSHEFNLGRFLSPDSLGGKPGDPQSWNRYCYVQGNPLKYVDPSGEQLVDTYVYVALKLALILQTVYDEGLLKVKVEGKAPVIPGKWLGKVIPGLGGRSVGIKGLEYFSLDLTGIADNRSELGITFQKAGLGASMTIRFDGIFPSDADFSVLGLVFEKSLTGGENRITAGVGAGVGVEASIKADPLLVRVFDLALNYNLADLIVQNLNKELEKTGQVKPGLRLVNGVLIRVMEPR